MPSEEPGNVQIMRTIGQWVEWAAAQLEDAGVHFGHGTDNSRDEAAWLVLYAVGAPLEDGTNARAKGWSEIVDDDEAKAVRRLVTERIERRCPAAYLTGHARFAGLDFEVGPDVLVPRSPIAELIEDGFLPWVSPEAIGSILDLGTGSGCIAIACALRFPGARVVGTDISEAALTIARRNAERHGVSDRVRLLRSDVFDSIEPGSYDLIVSNPPYVSESSFITLPDEYHAEPAVGLLSGMEGLEIPLRILADAARYLTTSGVLVCEVGESQDRLQDVLPTVPFLWLDFSSGGEGVFLLEQPQLEQAGEAAAGLLRELHGVT